MDGCVETISHLERIHSQSQATHRSSTVRNVPHVRFLYSFVTLTIVISARTDVANRIRPSVHSSIKRASASPLFHLIQSHPLASSFTVGPSRDDGTESRRRPVRRCTHRHRVRLPRPRRAGPRRASIARENPCGRRRVLAAAVALEASLSKI